MATAILIILDGLGVGGAPDAAAYGDTGSDTLANMAAQVGGLTVPNLRCLGLGNLHTITGVDPVVAPVAAFGRLEEVSVGKDSTTGHWELMGLVTDVPFPTYPDGFPDEVIEEFTRLTGYGVLGNKAASGTDIIRELGDEHRATGKLIVYTSADSVFQIAAHDDVCSLEDLYRVCEISRDMLQPPHQVSRVIARPFTGPPGAYERTPFRHDYALNPPPGMILPTLQAHGVKVLSVGKIYDLYAGVGIDETFPSKSNAEGMAEIERLRNETGDQDTLLLLNLVDFDMLWGHRNDPEGMKKGLEIFDAWLGPFLADLAPGTLLLLTADHGNDPTTASTDHSREHVPLLAYLAGGPPGADLGTRRGFMDVAATLAEFFGSPPPRKGSSFLSAIQKGKGSVNKIHHRLVEAACEARLHSHSPYSGFRVGAALLGLDGSIHRGTNVENSSLGLSICAERTAVCRAVADGVKEFEAIAICADGAQPTPPCGACRQFLREFGRDLTVLICGDQGPGGEILQYSLNDLIPHAFETYLDTRPPAADDREG